MSIPVFPPGEYERRLAAVRRSMEERDLDALLVSTPENIYYLCGFDHMGYFAYQALLVPASGTPVLITRAMEKSTVADQVGHLAHVGYADGVKPPAGAPESDDLVLATTADDGRAAGLRPWEMSYGHRAAAAPAAAPSSAQVDATVEALTRAGLTDARVGIEKNSSFLPLTIAEPLFQATPRLAWVDASGVVDLSRIVQSPLELVRTRAAAQVSDAMMLSAIAAAGPGVPSHDVMAAIYDAMFRRGGTYPGFVPLVRSTRTLQHEHGTWQDARLRKGDLLFLEMAGCVRRYHAPIGRLVFIGARPARAGRTQQVCEEAMMTAAEAMRPGARAGEVYARWQDCLRRHGLETYSRHHCGYSVGIGYPPSWSGGGVPVGLRPDSELELAEGMVFHLMSWLLRTGRGDFFLSDTAVVTGNGCEILTSVDRGVCVR